MEISDKFSVTCCATLPIHCLMWWKSLLAIRPPCDGAKYVQKMMLKDAINK